MDRLTSIKIYETDELDKFKILDGNRDYSEHAKRIVRSIKKYGLVRPLRIVVTPDMRVFDGQSRLEAARELGLSVQYEIDSNATIDKCRTANRFRTNWNIKDFIHSFAAVEKSNDYIEVSKMLKKYPKLPTTSIIYALTGTTPVTDAAEEGKLRVYPNAKDIVADGIEFIGNISNEPMIHDYIPGSKADFYCGLLHAAGQKSVSRKRLVNQLMKLLHTPDFSLTISGITSAIFFLEEVYNKNRGPIKGVNLIGAFKDSRLNHLTWWGAKQIRFLKNKEER